MNFASDNIVGASTPVLEALLKANAGAKPAYGGDDVSARVAATFAEIFEREVAVFPVTTGTAANALALSAAVPPYGFALCHSEAHILLDECGAPEFFMHGAKLVGLPADGGKLAASTVAAYLADLPAGVQQMPAKALSISQVTEAGTVYRPDEIAVLAAICRQHGLALHMDGARFANALVALDCTPAEMTWKQGVDILSFGGTKNGCLMAEAILVFDPALAENLAYRCKQAGQTISKGRLIAAQFEGFFTGDHWLENARHANRMASLASEGLARLPGVRLAWPTEANEVFPIVPRALDSALRAAGAHYHARSTTGLSEGQVLADDVLIRLVFSFASAEEDVRRFLDVAASSLRRQAAE